MKVHLFIALSVSAALLIGNGCDSSNPQTQSGDFDLVALSVLYPTPVRVGEKVTFTYKLTNNGTNAVRAGSYHVDFYIDGRLIFWDHATSDLRPGAFTTYSMPPDALSWQPTNAGLHRYRFVIDEANTVRERVETNNVLEGVVDVLP